jgi:hypothetical protein
MKAWGRCAALACLVVFGIAWAGVNVRAAVEEADGDLAMAAPEPPSTLPERYVRPSGSALLGAGTNDVTVSIVATRFPSNVL